MRGGDADADDATVGRSSHAAQYSKPVAEEELTKVRCSVLTKVRCDRPTPHTHHQRTTRNTLKIANRHTLVSNPLWHTVLDNNDFKENDVTSAAERPTTTTDVSKSFVFVRANFFFAGCARLQTDNSIFARYYCSLALFLKNKPFCDIVIQQQLLPFFRVLHARATVGDNLRATTTATRCRSAH